MSRTAEIGLPGALNLSSDSTSLAGPSEEWRKIEDYPDYEVSDFGRVKGNKFGKIRLLKPGRTAFGYPVVLLYKKVNGRFSRKFYNIHRLVLIAFMGWPPKGYEACHNNGNPEDNRLSNLRWDTHKNNLKDRAIHGTLKIGIENCNSKIINENVHEIFEMASEGISQREIGRKYGLSQPAICYILNRKTWKHVER